MKVNFQSFSLAVLVVTTLILSGCQKTAISNTLVFDRGQYIAAKGRWSIDVRVSSEMVYADISCSGFQRESFEFSKPELSRGSIDFTVNKNRSLNSRMGEYPATITKNFIEMRPGGACGYVKFSFSERLIAEIEPQTVQQHKNVSQSTAQIKPIASVSDTQGPIKIVQPKIKGLDKPRQEQDSLQPTLQIAGKYSKDATGFIEGRVSDNVGVVELLVNDQPIAFGNDGRFTHQEYLPTGGKEFTIVAIDRAGLKTTETVRLNREASKQVAKVSFDSLNPTIRRVKANSNALALIVGVSEYSLTAPAEFADRDAQVFYDYAHLKLGIPQEHIQTLVNDSASVVGMLSGINKWLKRSVKQGESDVYIFFAGHGLASDDGDTAYLIPYDGAPDFLERTAISRDEVFREVSSVNPRSVTVFLDTCYSGDTRGETRLIAGRPLSIKLQEQSLPKGFTVLTAAGGDQIAKPLKEAQHGLFSYFLMKGMEGGADFNSDNQITARELHTYVRENVVQQSGGSQVPELQGDGERVLVRFR